MKLKPLSPVVELVQAAHTSAKPTASRARDDVFTVALTGLPAKMDLCANLS